MLLKTVFLNLYPIVGLISVSAYLPQIMALMKASAAPTNISLKSWLLWVLSSAISLGYGVFCLQDSLFIAITLVGLILMVFVIGLVIYKRYVTFGSCNNFLHAVMLYFLCKPFFGVPEHVTVKAECRKK